MDDVRESHGQRATSPVRPLRNGRFGAQRQSLSGLWPARRSG